MRCVAVPVRDSPLPLALSISGAGARSAARATIRRLLSRPRSVMTPDWSPHLPAGVDPASVDLLADRSLPGSWTRHWASDGGRRVLWSEERGWTSAAELEERTRRVAGRLAAAGLGRGDRLVLSAGTSRDTVVAHVAALRLGLVVVPVNGAYGEREVAGIVRDCTPRAAVFDDAARGRWVQEAAPDRVVLVGPDVDLPDGSDVPLDEVGPDDAGLLVYTSGTTGAPKGALLSHGNLLASAEAVRLAWRWTQEDRLVLALPLFHVHGLGVGLHGTLTAGASAVLRPSSPPTTCSTAPPSTRRRCGSACRRCTPGSPSRRACPS